PDFPDLRPCQSHCCRTDCSPTDRRLILRHILDRSNARIAEVMSHTSVEMNIHKSRDHITAFAVDHLAVRLIYRDESSVPDSGFSFCKNSVFPEYFYILDNHLYASFFLLSRNL